MTDKPQEDISRQDVLTRIERVIQTIVITVSKGEAPVLSVMNRSSWANVRFHKSVGLVLKEDVSVKALRCDCPSSATRFALILKLLSVIYKLVQSDSYATKRDIYYNDPQLFGSQTTLDSIVDDVSCMLKVPRRSLHVLATSKGFISGALCYLEEDGTKVDCSSSSTAVPVSSNVNGIRSILPVYFNHGKGVPDVNSRLMVRKLWDTLHVPVFALVDADPHGIEIMCIYKYGSLVETMQRLKQKAEIQSLASIAPHFLTRVYLPNKLRYGGWI
ncbi:meiotic recombination SPO11 [Labeo rohita]|uniref:DNA topoisomerase (ATP-hydrolyzing) n=1 Tax=Labeo rohita TaxID=84645 RepID=A0A498LBA0_LABRO|nr:meiotic recombination SPO11 [Labeo rohita]